jgi:hypothetical protein
VAKAAKESKNISLKSFGFNPESLILNFFAYFASLRPLRERFLGFIVRRNYMVRDNIIATAIVDS